MTTRISEHFTLAEFVKSDTANRRGIKNTPTEAAFENICQLCHQILEPIREAYGHPIRINSGYRSEALNKAVGGARTSQHLTGEAADISCTATTKAELFHMIRELIAKKKIYVGQLIWEYGDENEPAWIHLSLPRVNKPNNQILYLYKK